MRLLLEASSRKATARGRSCLSGSMCSHPRLAKRSGVSLEMLDLYFNIQDPHQLVSTERYMSERARQLGYYTNNSPIEPALDTKLARDIWGLVEQTREEMCSSVLRTLAMYSGNHGERPDGGLRNQWHFEDRVQRGLLPLGKCRVR